MPVASAGSEDKKPEPFSLGAALASTGRNTLRTLGLVWRTSPFATVLMGGLTVASSVLPIAIAVAAKGIIDGVVATSRALTVRWVIIELVLVASAALLQRGLFFIREQLGARLALDVNVLILEKALTLELAQFEDGAFYDSLTKARREASYRPVNLITEGFQLVRNLLTLIGYAALIVRYSAWGGLALVVAAVPATLVETRFSRKLFKLRNWRSPESRQLNYLEYVVANDNHVKEVKLFGLGPMLLGRYRALGEKFYREDRALAARRQGWAFALSLVGEAAYYACYAGMALAAAAGHLTLGMLTLYVTAFMQGQQALQSVLNALGGIYEDNLYMSNLFEYLEAGPVKSLDKTSSSSLPIVTGERGIRFENVGFRYPGSDKWVLRGVNLYVPHGQSVALVGPNGAGKTTLIKLLARLYAPSEGRVILDGKDLREWDEATLRARIGVIFQDFNRYQFTVGENVGVGALAHLEDEPRVTRAVERGGAEEVVRGLPSGLGTRLGKWAHEGQELSGGQWQKVALARAFMREEADILVLDEPTAALDAEAEHAVFERFQQLAAGRTTFLISHRFSTVRMADRILVIDGGNIVEDGAHSALVNAGQGYAKLFKLQAAGYV